MRQYLFIWISFMLLTSCFKEDKLLPPSVIYDKIGYADMGSEPGKEYLNQLYFDLSGNRVVKQNKKDEWDLALKCGGTGPNLFVNQAISMAVAKTGSFDFNADYNTSDYLFKYERVEEFYTKGRIAADFDNEGVPAGEVFIIDMGTNLAGRSRGYKLLQVLSWREGTYKIRIADLDHSNLHEFEVTGADTYNYVYCSFAEPEKVLELEPPKEEWDLLFTKYMERLSSGNDTLDYSVTGCLLNPYFTKAALYRESADDSKKNYNDLRLNDLDESLLSSRTDIIGYDWKHFDLESETYTIYDDKLYFVRDVTGNTYKMHFTGFLGNDGRRGVISFAYMPL